MSGLFPPRRSSSSLSIAVALTLGIVSPVANSTSSFLILAPSFAQVKVYPTGDGPNAVAVADLNGDGKPDLAVANDWPAAP